MVVVVGGCILKIVIFKEGKGGGVQFSYVIIWGVKF